jgi:S-adenosylmethionine:tRNA ribosyltransferase-isomerase
MKLSDFDYKLPKELIAQEPIKPRDHSRLLVLDKNTGEIKHKHFYDLIAYLKRGDVLVLNNTRVFPARLIAKKETGGKIEVFLHKFIGENKWQCLVGGRGARPDLKIFFNNKLNCKIIKNNNNGTWDIEFNMNYQKMMKEVEKIGKVPLPPYIKRKKKQSIASSKNDKENYQTIYAHAKKIGSVAAPTAGLHFTSEIIQKLKKKGVQFEYITLHVGLGTFAPVKTENIKDHQMHSEYIEISKKTMNNIYKAKQNGKRIIAIGTTSVRSLESAFTLYDNPVDASTTIQPLQKFNAWTDIFIYPGKKFKIIDALITNFHLPKSTLLMLIQAFAGKKNINKAYAEAIQKKYRFFSYGDAMFIY